jgi:hypothetical protein
MKLCIEQHISEIVSKTQGSFRHSKRIFIAHRTETHPTLMLISAAKADKKISNSKTRQIELQAILDGLKS